MRITYGIICVAAVLALSSCTVISGWLNRQNMRLEEKFAANEVAAPAHPVGVVYEVISSVAPRKQISIFFNGKGMARVLEQGDNWDRKTLIDFKKQQVLHMNFSANLQETKALDPYTFPCVLNAMDAEQAKASCLGVGATRGFPYHRWGLRKNAYEWEVWTDDRDSFPIYYRSIKGGDVTTWTLLNSWIDGSTYNSPTFFSLQPDPPPPEPIKSQEETEKKEAEKQKRACKKRAKPHVHYLRKRANNSSAQ